MRRFFVTLPMPEPQSAAVSLLVKIGIANKSANPVVICNSRSVKFCVI